MARPLSAKGLVLETCIEAQVAAIWAEDAMLRGERKEALHCIKVCRFRCRQMAGMVEGLTTKPVSPSR